MKRLVGILLVSCSCIASAQSADQQKSSLIALAKSRSAALVTGDSVKMKEILDESFYYVNSEGIKRNRKEYLKGLFLSGDSKWLGQEIEDMDVRLVGTDAAILNFIVLDKFHYEGKEYAVHNRSTFVYAKKGETWKCMSGHTTEIK